MNPKNSNPILPICAQLCSVVMNFREQRSIARTLFESDLPKVTPLMGAGHGVVENYELRFIEGEGYAILGLKQADQPVALAGLAMESAAGEILWDEMLQHHTRMLRAFGKNLPDPLHRTPPDSLPWIQISLLPSYVEAASAMELHKTLSVLWTAAFAALDHNHRSLKAACSASLNVHSTK